MTKEFYDQLCKEATLSETEIELLQQQIDELVETLNALMVLKNKYEIENEVATEVKPKKKSHIRATSLGGFSADEKHLLAVPSLPDSFSPNLIQLEKVYFIIFLLGKAFGADIAKEWKKLEPGIENKVNVEKVSKDKASMLYSTYKLIGAKKVGNKNEYFIK